MLHEIWTFIRRHWPHLLLVAPGALLITLVHEGAHAAAVLLQGGTLLEFVWLPVADKWGHVSYDPSAVGVFFSPFLVAIAPYILWLLLAAVVGVLSLRRRQFTFAAASSQYFWMFVAPLADVANTAFPYLDGRYNDFMQAFGPPTWSALVITALLGTLALVAGHPVQCRLYRTQGLSLPAYLMLSSAVVVLIMVLTVGGF